jgi:hypothetical protein
MSENVGASTSRNHKGLHGLYGDNFTLPYQDVVKMIAQNVKEIATTTGKFNVTL